MFCGTCGSKLIEKTFPEAISQTAFDPYEFTKNHEPKRSTKGWLVAFVAVVAVVIVGVATTLNSNSGSTTTDTSLSDETYSSSETYTTGEDYAPEAPVEWAPAGFDTYDDDLAVKWVTNEGDWPCDDCNFWKLKVISQYGCPNGVYGEINMLDANDTVVNWTNDSIPSLGSNQSAILIFENYPYDDYIESGQLVELNCHG